MDEGGEGGVAKGESEPKYTGDGPGDQNSQEEGAPGRLASPQPHCATLTSPETGTQFSRTACGVACWAASETTGVSEAGVCMWNERSIAFQG